MCSVRGFDGSSRKTAHSNGAARARRAVTTTEPSPRIARTGDCEECRGECIIIVHYSTDVIKSPAAVARQLNRAK